MFIKKNHNTEKDVVVYSIGFKEFEEMTEEVEDSSRLHVTQVVKKAEGDGNLTVVIVEFPHNGQDYRIMLVKVLNFNSQISTRRLIRQQKDDSNFWVLLSDGEIGTNSVTIEINSLIDIDADVEFYGYKETENKNTFPPHASTL